MARSRHLPNTFPFLLTLACLLMGACRSDSASAAATTSSAQSGGLTQQPPSGNGKRFGTRDTRDCSLAADHPTPAQIQQAFICGEENVVPSSSFGDRIDLVSEVNLQVSKGRPYNMATDAFKGIDVTQRVYDVRGFYIHWQCRTWTADPNPMLPQPGRNCYKFPAPAAIGIAFRDTFGNWHVPVVGEGGDTIHYFPPPTEQ